MSLTAAYLDSIIFNTVYIPSLFYSVEEDYLHCTYSIKHNIFYQKEGLSVYKSTVVYWHVF